jgi:hypothetical protein
LIDVDVYVDVGVVSVTGLASGADIGHAIFGIDHQLFDCVAKLLRGTVIAAGQFSNSSIEIWLSPELGSAIVEQIEVVSVVPFLLNYLELDIPIVQSLAVNL